MRSLQFFHFFLLAAAAPITNNNVPKDDPSQFANTISLNSTHTPWPSPSQRASIARDSTEVDLPIIARARRSSGLQPILPRADNPTTAHSTIDLLTLVDAFDMIKHFKIAGPIASDTNTLSACGMSNFPSSLTFIRGTFDPEAIISDRAARFRLSGLSGDVYREVATVVESTRLTMDMYTDPISGETGLSHALYQQLGGPINQILKAIGVQGLWTAKGKGCAPKEDWNLNSPSKTLAVLELKTPHSLSSEEIDEIIQHVGAGEFTVMKLDGKGGGGKGSKGSKGGKGSKDSKDSKDINSLVCTDGLDLKMLPVREKRAPFVRAFEQVLAQMFENDAYVGALGSGDHWLVLETDGSTVRVSRAEGVRPNGKSNSLLILLAMSLIAGQLPRF